MIPQAATYPRAKWALAMGIASMVLIWPFGIVLGPLALLFGISVVRHINGSGGALAGAAISAGAAPGYYSAAPAYYYPYAPPPYSVAPAPAYYYAPPAAPYYAPVPYYGPQYYGPQYYYSGY